MNISFSRLLKNIFEAAIFNAEVATQIVFNSLSVETKPSPFLRNMNRQAIGNFIISSTTS